MRAAILSFTRKGARLTQEIKEVLEQQGYDVEGYTIEKYMEETPGLHPFEPDLHAVVSKAFLASSLLVFIGACGIAVRTVAPFIQDKKQDPAVICIDEKGLHVIPLLSGHIGGANRIAKDLAFRMQAHPVITTATDINGLIAIDDWASRNQVYISDMDLAKKVSASLVDGKSVGLHSDFQLSGEIPREFLLKEECDVGICISLDESKKPFPHTLNLIPRIVCLGIGCRKGIEAEVIETQAFDVLRRQKVSINAVCGVASVDLKREEKGLLRFAERYRLPVAFYSSDTLNCLPGKYTASAFVEQVSGVDNVCERAAVMLSQNGELISSKTAKDGVTAALAMKRWRVRLCDEE